MTHPPRSASLVCAALLGCSASTTHTETRLRLRVTTTATVTSGDDAPTGAPAPARPPPRTSPPTVETRAIPRCLDPAGAPLHAEHLVGSRGRFCTLHAGGSVCCWGHTLPPEEGDSDYGSGWSYPHRVESLPPVQQVALGARHACALGRDGRVLCWGDGTSHQLGAEAHAPRATGGPVPGLGPAEEIVAADDQTCARTTDAAVRCWGGRGGLAGSGSLDAPRRVEALPAIARFVVGPIPCGLDPTGTLVCWHNNGRIDVGPRTAAPVVRFPQLAPARTFSLAVDAYQPFLNRGCSLAPDGTVRCFRPRQGTCEGDPCDEPVEGLGDVVSLAAGTAHQCAVRRDGTVWCWGSNRDGSLGDGTVVPRAHPQRVDGLTGVIEVAATGNTSCALGGDGTVRCWGHGAHGVLGNGTLAPQLTPRRVRFDATPEPPEPAPSGPPDDPCVAPREPSPRQPPIVSLATGDLHNCVALADGTVRCWGTGRSGALGDESRHGDSAAWSPVEAVGLGDAVQVAVADSISCALRRDRSVWCWGSDGERQIRGQQRSMYDRPVPWPGGGYAEVAVCQRMVCARRLRGTVVCSGGFAHRQARWEVALPAPAVQLQSGARRTCALLRNGRAACWTVTHPEPVVSEPFPARPLELAVSTHHACARLVDGTVACWGDGNHGQLGLGAVGDVVQPTRVVGLDRVVAVTVSDDRSCATRDDRTVWCWGSNRTEQGVSGTGESFPFATPLGPLGPVETLRLGGAHACALLVGGPLCCWGSDDRGQLGRGPRQGPPSTPAARPAPLQW